MSSSGRKKLIALICITASIMSPSVSFAGDTWKKIKNHFKSCEIKVQGATTKQWADIINPKRKALYSNSGSKTSKLTKKEKILVVISASIVVGAAVIAIHNHKPLNNSPPFEK